MMTTRTGVSGALVLTALLGAALLVQDHPKPADDYFCSHDDHAPADHQCACVKTCEKGEDGRPVVREDPQCKVWCYKDHCRCPSPCQATH